MSPWKRASHEPLRRSEPIARSEKKNPPEINPTKKIPSKTTQKSDVKLSRLMLMRALNA
jgi:hypothetical protein